MAKGKINKTSVDALQSGAADVFLWDEDLAGFGVKATPAGRKSYVFQYRVGGRGAKTRRWTIGPHGSPWTAKTARDEAERLSTLVRQGIDPVAAEQARRRDAIDLGFDRYAERFIQEYLKVEWVGGWELAAGLLRREAVPAFKNKSLREIKRSDISAFLDRMTDRPATRRNAYAAVRRLFKWAVNRGDIDETPLRDMDAPPAPASRDRVLRDEELVCVWHGAGELGFPYGPLTRLLIATGQRREEVSGLKWDELDQQNSRWTLPGSRSKNGVAHDIPLSAIAIKVFDALAGRKRNDGKWPKRGLIFSHDGEKAVRGYSVAKTRLDREVAKVAAKKAVERHEHAEDTLVAPWRFHDLRRTLATGMQRLGVRFEVTEAVLNHLSGSKAGVAGVYQRHNWAGEKRAALDAWGNHVSKLVHGTDPVNVVQLAERRA